MSKKIIVIGAGDPGIMAAAMAATIINVIPLRNTKGDFNTSCKIVSNEFKTKKLLKSALLAGDSPYESLNHINRKSRRKKRKDF